MPDQRGVTWIRLKVLADAHCDVTDCARPLCVEQAVASYCRSKSITTLTETPPACPLRAHPVPALAELNVKAA